MRERVQLQVKERKKKEKKWLYPAPSRGRATRIYSRHNSSTHETDSGHGVKFRGLPATAQFGDVAGPYSSG